MQQLHAGSYPHIQQNTHGGEFAGGGGGLPILLPSHQAVATTSPLSGFKPAAVVPTSPHLAGAAGACRPPTAMPSAAHLTQQHHSSALIDENRHRYHVYERESTWAEVEKLSGYISRYAVAEAASPTDISKEKYYDLFNIGVHLLKAIETLDPDRSVSPKTEQQFGGSSTMSSPLQRPLGQAGFHGTHPAMPPLPSTHAGTSPPPFPQARSMSPHTFSPNPDSLPSFLSRGYTSEPGGARASSKVPPPAPAPIGIARYNQSIVSGMLSMGQPPMGVSPSPKQLPVEPEHHQQGLSQEGQMSAEAGESNSSGGSRKKRRRKVQRRDLHCHVCGVVDTPEWRRGPDGDHTLCNACGLHYAKALKKEKEAREKEGRKHSIDMLLNNQQGRENARGAVESSNSSLDLNC